MKQKSVRWRRFTDTPYGTFCSLHKEITIGVLTLAMLASFDVKAQTPSGASLEKATATNVDEAVAVMDSVEVENSQAPLKQNNGARTEKSKIYGKLTDKNGRCVHYHTVLDVIANKCAICGKFYSCYKCHNEIENHPFGAVSSTEEASVMCGVCGYQFSYAEYEKMKSECKNCGAHFNPRCSLHKCIYSTTGENKGGK